MNIEYRVKPVTRYIVTRHDGEATRQIGNEYDNAEVAYEVGYALARQDAERLGLSPGDMGVIYPEDPRFANARPVAA